MAMRLEKFLSVIGFFDDPRRDVMIEFATEGDELEVGAFVIDADFRTVSILLKEKPETENNGDASYQSEPPF